MKVKNLLIGLGLILPFTVYSSEESLKENFEKHAKSFKSISKGLQETSDFFIQKIFSEDYKEFSETLTFIDNKLTNLNRKLLSLYNEANNLKEIMKKAREDKAQAKRENLAALPDDLKAIIIKLKVLYQKLDKLREKINEIAVASHYGKKEIIQEHEVTQEQYARDFDLIRRQIKALIKAVPEVEKYSDFYVIKGHNKDLIEYFKI